MGKGSSRRPTDNKKFVDNYDRIFNKKLKIVQNKPKIAKSRLQNSPTDDLNE